MVRVNSGKGTAGRGERALLCALLGGAGIVGAINLLGAMAGAVSASLGNRVSVALVSGDERRGTGLVDRVAFPEAVVTADLSDGARVLLAAGDLLGSITAVAVSASVALLCWRMLQQRPFTRSVTNAAYFAGASLVIGGMLSQVSSGFGRMVTADEVRDDAGAFLQTAFLFDGTPLLAGCAVLAFALVLEFGQRMQRRIAQLERETHGLV